MSLLLFMVILNINVDRYLLTYFPIYKWIDAAYCTTYAYNFRYNK